MRLVFLFIVCLFAVTRANGGVVELSGLASYSKNELDENYTSKVSRYTGSVEVKFTRVSAIKFAYTNARTRINQLVSFSIAGLVDSTKNRITVKDQIYSVLWVQNLISSKYILQPFFEIGGGRRYRTHISSFDNSLFPRTEKKSSADTGVGGLGFRLFLTKRMALKGEILTYVPDFRFSLWKENQFFSLGLSWVL